MSLLPVAGDGLHSSRHHINLTKGVVLGVRNVKDVFVPGHALRVVEGSGCKTAVVQTGLPGADDLPDHSLPSRQRAGREGFQSRIDRYSTAGGVEIYD